MPKINRPFIIAFFVKSETITCIQPSYVILKICATILVSINSSSELNCLIAYLGASMGQKLLSAVAVMTFRNVVSIFLQRTLGFVSICDPNIV